MNITQSELIEMAKKSGMNHDDIMPNTWMCGHQSAVKAFAAEVWNRAIEQAARKCDSDAYFAEAIRALSSVNTGKEMP